jgi:hypothetical protein
MTGAWRGVSAWRGVPTWRAVVAVMLAAGLLAGAAGCGTPRPGPVEPRGSASASAARGHNPAVATQRGPKPPETGAWLGAWVRPAWSTPDGRAGAFTDFERAVGAQLPIVHMFRDGADEFPAAPETALLREADMLLLSWAGTDTRSIAQGTYDAEIRRRAEGIKALRVPLFLRFRWEMDRPNLAATVHSPEDYIAAWKRTRQIFTEVGATNAAFVWCPHVEGFVESARRAADYYPGDDQVEWLCVDVYSAPDNMAFGAQMDTFRPFAEQHAKPIMVAEFGAVTGNGSGQRNAWVREARTYTKAHPQIKALVWFNAKMDRKPFFDTGFTVDTDGLDGLRELAADPYFQAPPPSKGT